MLVVVQAPRDSLRRGAVRELGEDAADDLGLRRVDRALARDRLSVVAQAPHHVVAVGIAAAGLAGLHAAAQAPSGLRRQVLQEQLVHRALEAHVKLADLALRQGRDAGAVEGQLLIERRDIRLVAAQAVQRLAQDQVDAAAARVVEQALKAGAVQRGAGDRHVSEGLHHRPALALGALHTEPHLVLDRGRLLHGGRVPGVDGDAHEMAFWPAPIGWSSFSLSA